MDFLKLIKDLRNCVDGDFSCEDCEYAETVACEVELLRKAADAIDELFNAGAAMHLWIFFHVADEQEVYKTCHISDELNRAFGSLGADEVRYGTDG